MEETAPAVFSYRRSHLKSETYRNLLRIISCCSSHPRLCETALFPSRHNISDDVSNGSGESQTEVGGSHLGTGDACKMHDNDNNTLDQNGSAVAVDVDLGSDGLNNKGQNITQAVINELENMMGIEDVCGGVVEELLKGNDGSSGTLPDGGLSGAQRMLISELEYALKGNEGSVLDGNCNIRTSSLEKNVGLQQETISWGERGFSASKVLDLTSVSKASFGAQDNSKFEDGEIEEGEISGKLENGDLIVDAAPETIVPSSEENSCKESHQNNETERKDSMATSFQMSMADHAGNSGAINDKGYIIDSVIGNRQVVVYEDSILNETPGSYDKMSRGRRARKRKKDHEATPQKNDGDRLSKKSKKGLEASGEKKHIDLEVKRKEIGHEPMENKKIGVDKNDINGKVNLSDNVPVEAHESSVNATAGERTTLKEKDAGPDNKKRGHISAERKAKKKQKERKKRAEKNREQGVKRLKLRPVQVSKPVSYCRHFLKGRCQEGQKCKFSHDTIPSTKSTPCSHFARQSCMKGDDCPFDHELFKYPCSKFVSEGSCIRGKACLFSHKVPLNEKAIPSTSNVGKPSSTPPSSLLGMPDSKKQLDISGTSSQMVKGLAPSTGYNSPKPLEQAATTTPRVPLRVPKGISFLSHGKPLAVDCNHLQPMSPANTDGTKCVNQAVQSASGKAQSLNETPVKRPPLGTNFLAFCRSPSGFPRPAKFNRPPVNHIHRSPAEVSPSTKFNRPPVNHRSPVEVSALNSSIADKISGLSAALDVRNRVGGQLNSSQVERNLGSAPFSLKTLHSSAGATSTSSSKLHERESSLNLTMVADKSASIKSLDNKGPNLPAYPPCNLTTSPSGLGQSSYNVGQGSNPLQKALMSTLAFAAKLDSEMKLNRSAGAVKCSTSDTAGASGSRVLQNTPPPTSNIMDILSIIDGTQNK